jgi:hypothetical protein
MIIVGDDRPKQFAIWNQTVTADTFASQRVPRQVPDGQFFRTLPGVAPALELELVYRNLGSHDLAGKRQNRSITKFELTALDGTHGEFLGFLGAQGFVYQSYGANALAGADQNLAVAYQRSPLTLGIFAVVVGYYVLFYLGVLIRSRVASPPMGDGALPGT